MITKQEFLQQVKDAIREQDAKGWGYGDVVRIAKQFGYSKDNIHRIKRKLKNESNKNKDASRGAS
jgi:hypothetical protein